MNFEECIQKIVKKFQNDERDCIYYIAKGELILYINGKQKKWTKIFLKGAIRKKSTYVFDIFLVIEKIYDSFYEIKAGRVIRKNYFNLGCNNKIPIKYKKEEYGNIKCNINYFEERTYDLTK